MIFIVYVFYLSFLTNLGKVLLMNFFTKFSSSIKLKLITISSLILIIPMFIIGSFGYLNSSNSLDELGKMNLENSVEHTIELISVLNDQVESGLISKDEAENMLKESILGEKQADGTRPI